MKTLLLMRHGDAPQAKHDSNRMLSALGKEQCRLMGEYLKPLHVVKCISSDYQRAIDSAQISCSALNNEIKIDSNDLLRPMSDAKQAFDFLCDEFDRIEEHTSLLIVCHLPIISELASLALDGVFNDHYRFPCASLMAVQSESALQGCFELLWQKSPAHKL